MLTQIYVAKWRHKATKPFSTWKLIILGMGPVCERRRYKVMPHLIGSAHTQNDPGMGIHENKVVDAMNRQLRYQKT